MHKRGRKSFRLKEGIQASLIMTDVDFHERWYQVRLFSKNFGHGFYAELLGKIVAPLVTAKPTTPLFFSRYVCPLGMDDGDTNIAALPPDYLLPQPQQQAPWHFSIRMRFREMRGVRSALRAIIMGEPDFWFSDISPCVLAGVLAADRFSTQHVDPAMSHRIRLVAELLGANCRIVLDTLKNQAGNWSFEASNNQLNLPMGSVAQSINHMIVNAWSLPGGQPLPVCIPIGNNQFIRL